MTDRQIRVYAWQDLHEGGQTRDIVAAHSVAEVLRLAGIPRSTYAWSGDVTDNDEEVAVAMAEPGVVFSTDLQASFKPGPNEWRRLGVAT